VCVYLYGHSCRYIYMDMCSVYMYRYVCVYICRYMLVNIFTYMDVCVFVHTSSLPRACTRVLMLHIFATRACVCVHMHTRTHARTHIQIVCTPYDLELYTYCNLFVDVCTCVYTTYVRMHTYVYIGRLYGNSRSVRVHVYLCVFFQWLQRRGCA